MRTMLLTVLAVLVGLVGPGLASGLSVGEDRDRDAPIRGVWVTRWDYLTEADVRRAMRELAGLGATDVFWQVRGQADAYYESELEPWGEDLFRGPNDGKAEPGFDPLAVAVEAAHAEGLRIHAWINAMPLWKNKTPPADRAHAWHARPEWRLVDQNGERQPLNDHYVVVDPLREDVRAHVAAVAADITRRYDVDGLHLDYIRFVTDAVDPSKVYPVTPLSRSMLEVETGSRDVSSQGQRAALRLLIRGAITDVVRRIREQAVPAGGDVALTAAVWRRPEIARDRYEQDAAAWLRDGLIDAAIPMIYTESTDRFEDDLAAWRAAVPGGRIVPGIGTYKHADGAETVSQLAASETDEFVLFAYSSMFESRAQGLDLGPKGDAERAARREPIAGALSGGP